MGKDSVDAGKVLSTFLKMSSKTDIQSQIDFIKYIQDNHLVTPVFVGIINSLKELQVIKKTQIPKITESKETIYCDEMDTCSFKRTRQICLASKDRRCPHQVKFYGERIITK